VKTDAAVLPSRSSPLGFVSWLRETVDAVSCSLAPPPYPEEELPRGHGETVLLIPGFLAGDWTMSRLRNFLTGLGYRVEQADIALNLGPTPGLLAQLEAALLRLTANGESIALIGQSLGGVMARDLAKRHPGRVARVITLCTPIHFPVTTPLAPFATMLAPLHDDSARASIATIAEPPPVAVTALYSEDDGIVDWRQCLQAETVRHRNIRVGGGHAIMGSNPDAQRAIALALSA
jgi:pimeloyl-ACP methyl ester carboxylesterase